MHLLDPLFRWPALDDIFSDRIQVQRMLDFEAGLARAEAHVGVIPSAAAVVIEKKCRAELVDFSSLSRSAASSGNLAIPLVRQLTSLVAQESPEPARHVHWGATSQDLIDTGLVLQLGEALGLIGTELERLSRFTAELVSKYRSTPIVARTWMQHALPTTFGFKTAGWLDALNRHRARLSTLRRQNLVLQFGGAVGTLAALNGKGLDVAQALAKELQLPLPEIPWHSHRDRIVEVASALGILTGTLAKIARDISLHAQTELAELSEPTAAGRGGSSTMPHKRNPVTSAVILSAATRTPALVSTLLSAMVQEDERGLGGWHAEWETLPEIVRLSGGALHHLTEIFLGLEIDPHRMRDNLDLTKGLIFAEAVSMALAKKVGLPQAHKLLNAASDHARSANTHLRDVLVQDPQVTKYLNASDLDRLFDPQQYLGVANLFIDRVLSQYQSSIPKSRGESE
jgi:3-carboxy-cis,cis-muconate cycloisomerase